MELENIPTTNYQEHVITEDHDQVTKVSAEKAAYEFPSTNVFRAKARDKDFHELEDYLASQSVKSKAFPGGKYGFSYTSAKKLLEEWEKSKEDKELDGAHSIPRKFVLEYERGQIAPKYVPRSFSIERPVLKLLNDLCEDYSRYPKKECINKIIKDGLALYGYTVGPTDASSESEEKQPGE